jgi:LmbE family N-acetylglucosaminyl deacetylase
MRPFYDAIYLSPHLDDAALSCGGQIFQQTAVGGAVLIVTIMAGDPPPGKLSSFAQSLHARWRLPAEVVAARRAEDVRACEILGADYIHWPIPDCVYRSDPASGQPLYPTWPDVIAGVQPADLALANELAQQLAALPAAGRVIGPLAAGNHADHWVTRMAAEQAFGGQLYYYEDYPYVADGAALTAVFSFTPHQWQAEIIPLATKDLAAKTAAIAAFTSQLSTFFSDEADLAQQVAAFTESIGGERVWWKTAV